MSYDLWSWILLLNNSEYSVFRFASKSWVYSSKVFNVFLVESNWTKVATLKMECDNLICVTFQIVQIPLMSSLYGIQVLIS